MCRRDAGDPSRNLDDRFEIFRSVPCRNRVVLDTYIFMKFEVIMKTNL